MNKKGFTLIELLAVIVVLAIIALIAVPNILNIIEKARQGATESSARSYIKAVETYVVSSDLDKSKTILIKNNKYNVTKTTTIDDKTYEAINNLVEIKGAKPNGTDDYITLGDNYRLDEAKLTINGYEIFLKNDRVVSITKNGSVIKESLLADVVGIGDYVAYDAGTWTETKDKPTSHGEFGGYTAGENKANSVSWCSVSEYTTSLKGWRVLNISGNTVTIIHAGQPECYYHTTGGYSDASIINLSNRAKSEYLNDFYASSAHMMNKNEIDAIEKSNNLRKIVAYYWAASQVSSSNLWHVNAVGSINPGIDKGSLGIRPVIVLKSNIKTIGKTIDAVGQEAWSLVAP